MSQPVGFQSIACSRTLLGAVLFATTLFANSALAQEASEADSAETKSASEKETLRPTLDLGQFKIKDLRPTRNVTAKVTFSLHLAFSNSLTKAETTELERWKHRLRDQIITAIRITPVKDFQAPDLDRFRHTILIRVNRLFQAKLAEKVFLTEYLFRTH